MSRRPPPSAVLCATLGALALCGCTRQANDRLALGEDIVPAAFAHGAQEQTPTDARVLGLDRSNWEPMVYEIPVNGVAHQPIYAPTTFGLETLPRQRGEYPTPLSALDLGEPSPTSELGQMFRSHGQAVLDAALLLPRLVLRPPTATDWSPRVSYDRASAPAISAPWCGACEGPCRGTGCAAAGAAEEPAPELRPETGQSEGAPQE